MEKNDKRFRMEERFVEWMARIGAILFFAFCIGCIVTMCSCDNELRKENERLREELAKAQQYAPMEKDTIRGTVEVVTQKIVEVEKIKNVLTSEDKQLLKDIDVKVKELESLQKTGMVTKDTVMLATAEPSPTEKDSLLRYRDAWTDIEVRGRQVAYSVRDSLTVAIKRQYKKRFLFWKWGTKGYDVKIVNFNPHSTIRYNTYVKRRQ